MNSIDKFFDNPAGDTPRPLARAPLYQEGNLPPHPPLSGTNPPVGLLGAVPSIKRGYRGVLAFDIVFPKGDSINLPKEHAHLPIRIFQRFLEIRNRRIVKKIRRFIYINKHSE